jgi:hypothetical protein
MQSPIPCGMTSAGSLSTRKSRLRPQEAQLPELDILDASIPVGARLGVSAFSEDMVAYVAAPGVRGPNRGCLGLDPGPLSATALRRGRLARAS